MAGHPGLLAAAPGHQAGAGAMVAAARRAARCGNQAPGQREKENRADGYGHCQATRGGAPFHTFQDIKRLINGKNFFPLWKIS
jgi:hypothetical protein